MFFKLCFFFFLFVLFCFVFKDPIKSLVKLCHEARKYMSLWVIIEQVKPNQEIDNLIF